MGIAISTTSNDVGAVSDWTQGFTGVAQDLCIAEKRGVVERGFSAQRHLIVSASIAVIAVMVWKCAVPLSIVLVIGSVWYAVSSALIFANRQCEGLRIQRFVQWIHGLTMDLTSMVEDIACTIPFLLFNGFQGKEELCEQTLKGRPILLLHGYLSFSGTWNFLKRRLEEEKLGPVYTMDLGSFKSIKTDAEYVAKRVLEIQEETGRKDITLIGHSRGGLVGSYYAAFLADPEEVLDVVTIGSPLSGTPLAYIAPGNDGQEMRPDSALIMELKGRYNGSPHEQIKFFHIGSSVDALVPLASSSWEKTPKENCFVVNDIGHLGLLKSTRVADQLCSWLQERV